MQVKKPKSQNMKHEKGGYRSTRGIVESDVNGRFRYTFIPF